MTLPLRLHLRAAGRLHNIWRSRAQFVERDEYHRLRRVQDCMDSLHLGLARLDKARSHRLVLALPILQHDLTNHLEELKLAIGVAKDAMTKAAPVVPTLVELVQEVQQIEDEFDEFQVDCKKRTVSAPTEPITLRDVYLGPFAIRFHWERLQHQADVSCFDVVALDPHPATADHRVTHPHVKDRSLCAGDASVPIRKALEQGRLADAFCLARSVLQHYNPESPHVSLDDWTGIECSDCGRNVQDDDHWCCESCGCDFCDRCTGNCRGCDASRCYGCLMRCDICDEYCCATCLEAFVSGKACCRRCIVNCTRCGQAVASNDCDKLGRCLSCRPPSESNHPEKKHDPDSQSVRPAAS